MTYKVHIIGNKFFVDELEAPLTRYEGFAKDVLSRTLTSLSSDFGFDNLNNWSRTKTLNFSEIDLTGADYTDLATFNTWLNNNTGKSSPSAAGASSFSGWIDYNNSLAPVTLSANVWTDISNNGAGAFSNRPSPPLAGGVTELMNTLNGRLDFSELKINDDLFIRHDFNITPDTNNASLEFRYLVGELGSEYPLEIPIPRLDRGSGISYKEVGSNYIYIGDVNTRDGGAKLQVRLSTTGTLVNNGLAIKYFIY